MKQLFILLGFMWFSAAIAGERDFTRSDTSMEFCKDIVANLAEVGVIVSTKSMTKCSLLVLAGASATFERPYGDPVNVRVKSDPYRMFVTRGGKKIGTCYVLYPRRVTRQVKERDC